MNADLLSFEGVLQPLVSLLEKNPRQKDKLVGQEVATNRKDTSAIIALDFTNNIHLLIAPAGERSHLPKIDLKGLKVSNTRWLVSGHPVNNYLDVSCSTGVMPLFKRPFLRFAEDILFEISQSQITPADAVHKTSVRWKKFWSSDSGNGVTKEWVHGLFGELLFLKSITGQFGADVVNCWTGPLGKDHDFQTSTILAVEVKTSVNMPFQINCNIHQLDSNLFKKLYIVCYCVATSNDGTTLPELVKDITHLIESNELLLEKFYELLAATGYKLSLESVYNDFRLSHSKAAIFRVDKNFPKITEESFIKPPDHRINNIRYTLELAGVKALKIEDISNDLQRLGEYEEK